MTELVLCEEEILTIRKLLAELSSQHDSSEQLSCSLKQGAWSLTISREAQSEVPDSELREAAAEDFSDVFLRGPVTLEGFVPMSRDEIYRRD